MAFFFLSKSFLKYARGRAGQGGQLGKGRARQGQSREGQERGQGRVRGGRGHAGGGRGADDCKGEHFGPSLP